jgi:tetratricopeptide (TPR) repeat protein
MKAFGLPLVVLALAQAGAPAAPAGSAATLAERLAWNARERTAAGDRALAAGDAESAARAFDTAQRLRPDDARTGYNAGTARMGVDDPLAAALLDAAAQAASAELAPSAWYNLGTARLAAGDAPGAVAALTEALRRDPARDDAKQNLELALAELERQRQQEPQPSPSGDAGDPESGSEGADAGDDDSASSQPSPSEEDSRGEDRGPPPGDSEDAQGAGEPTTGGQGERPLPQFRDLPDMTAEQAAAILRAVDDLERQHRRERAQRAAAQRAQVEIDW